MSIRKTCKCGCQIVFETDLKPPKRIKCFMCKEEVVILKDEEKDTGTEGQDRESYTDTQDRDSYTIEEPEVVVEKKKRGRPKGVKRK